MIFRVQHRRCVKENTLWPMRFVCSNAAFGTASCMKIRGEIVCFRENMVSKHNKLDERNLICCTQLSLRHSSVSMLDTRFLLLLEHIDIALSQVQDINFIKCISLNTVVKDYQQKVFVKRNVNVFIIYNTK